MSSLGDEVDKKMTNNDYKVDWNDLWNQSLKNLPKKNNSELWDKIAPKFNRWMKKDDYPEMILSKIKTEPSDNIFGYRMW